MATPKYIEPANHYLDKIFQQSIGGSRDISCAMYNGNFALTPEEVQKAQNEYILHGIGFKKGDRILDIGRGSEPFLKAIKEHEGEGIG